jgi:hypothetical protein
VSATNKAIGVSMIFIWSFYVIVGFVGIYSFGIKLDTNMLVNIGVDYTDNVYPEAFVMQALFIIILSCHIPFVFFAGKESLLIIIDELMRSSLSYALEKKMLELKQNS